MSTYQAPVDPTGVPGKRVVAAIIDVGLGWLLYWILFALLAEQIDNFGLFDPCSSSGVRNCVSLGDTTYTVSGAQSLLLNLLVLSYFVGVFVLQRGVTGKTLGTMVLGIVTVNEAGRPPGVGYALLRSVAGIVDYIPCCLPLVGTITIFATTGHRRVGDMAAKTYVIDKAYVGQPVVVPGLTSAPTGTPYAQPYPVAGAGQPAAPPAGSPGAGPVPEGTQPQWDPQRNAYIQWDPTAQRWMVYDESLRQWRQID